MGWALGHSPGQPTVPCLSEIIVFVSDEQYWAGADCLLLQFAVDDALIRHGADGGVLEFATLVQKPTGKRLMFPRQYVPLSDSSAS